MAQICWILPRLQPLQHRRRVAVLRVDLDCLSEQARRFESSLAEAGSALRVPLLVLATLDALVGEL